MSLHCSALIQSELINIHAAFCRPINAGNVIVLPASATKPSSENGHRSRALAAINAKSASPHTVAPTPTPSPFTATTKGLGNSAMMCAMPPKPCTTFAVRPASERSAPALNARPAPVRTTTLTSSSSRADRKASATSSNCGLLNALRASGRFNVSVRTRF